MIGQVEVVIKRESHTKQRGMIRSRGNHVAPVAANE